MAGIYGNNDEDKFFENKLLNREDKMEDGETKFELNDTIIEHLEQESENMGIHAKEIMTNEIIPILEILFNEDILDASHLKNQMERLTDLGNEMDEIYRMSDDIIYYADKIQRRTRD